jgi:hypothetical protein
VKRGLAVVAKLINTIGACTDHIGGEKDSQSLRSKLKELLVATKQHIREVRERETESCVCTMVPWKCS